MVWKTDDTNCSDEITLITRHSSAMFSLDKFKNEYKNCAQKTMGRLDHILFCCTETSKSDFYQHQHNPLLNDKIHGKCYFKINNKLTQKLKIIIITYYLEIT